MRHLTQDDINSFRGVLAFAVLAHVLDLITTHFRDPLLVGEGNPILMIVTHFGIAGWRGLVLVKLVTVFVYGLAHYWYLGVRTDYLPFKRINSTRALIWYGMWDRRPYPPDLWHRLFNRRKLAFLGVILASAALPGSGAAAIYISLDNISYRLGRGLPANSAATLLMITIAMVYAWWIWAYDRWYHVALERGLIPQPDGLPPCDEDED
jgi:hypothetical protein